MKMEKITVKIAEIMKTIMKTILKITVTKPNTPMKTLKTVKTLKMVMKKDQLKAMNQTSQNQKMEKIHSYNMMIHTLPHSISSSSENTIQY